MRCRTIAILFGLLIVITIAINIFTASIAFRSYKENLAVRLEPSGNTDCNIQRLQKSERIIIYFGDSRISQWKQFSNFEGFKSYNYGIGGQTTAQMLFRLEREVLNQKSDIVIIQAGINDLKAIGVFPKQEQDIIDNCIENLSEMVRKINDTGSKVLLMTVISPYKPDLLRRFVWSDRIEGAVQLVNEKLMELESDMVIIFDTSFLAENGRMQKQYARDCLHLNTKGYMLLNENLKPVLEWIVNEKVLN